MVIESCFLVHLRNIAKGHLMITGDSSVKMDNGRLQDIFFVPSFLVHEILEEIMAISG
jgi:hypothetical protein